MRRYSREDIGRSLDLEVKRCGVVHIYQSLKGKWNSVAAQMLHRFVEIGHPIFTGTSSLNRGDKNTIHFNAESSHVELLFRIIHSANQLSVYGAVSSWSGQHSFAGAEPSSGKFVESEEIVDEETAKSVKPEDGNCLVDSARSWYAAGNSRQDDLHDIRLMDILYWTARICEAAAFWNLVENGKYHRTHPDMDEGFGGVRLACTEYSRPRQEKGSTVLGVKPRGIVIGPVQQFVVVKIMVGTCGIVIEIPSPTRVGQLIWVMMCRGYTRYVDEVLGPMSYYNIPSKELVTEQAVDTAEPCSEDRGQFCNEETHPKQ